jgi:hypothetical protein
VKKATKKKKYSLGKTIKRRKKENANFRPQKKGEAQNFHSFPCYSGAPSARFSNKINLHKHFSSATAASFLFQFSTVDYYTLRI